ncbi:MAG TPA: nucleotide sugar dehydrogenase [Candidatus Limnocylindrales bacterium]|nr:nucleotide sugar dehydrogenase [Candidatus Limnocylindrales bacterium]
MHLFLIGAGHVGLVTAVGLARLGHRLTVADIDATRIEGLRRGVAPIYEPGLEDAIGELLASASLAFTTDLAPPDDARFSIVTVSTPTGPDGPLSTTNVEAVVAGLLAATGVDHTIIVRSTLPVDGPARLIGLRGGRTDAAAIVTNPEFMREGTALRDFDKPDRLVVGWLEERDRPAADAVLALYDGIDAKTLVADAPSVALVKLATNVFLATKVAYANELARICDVVGADVDTVADGIGLDPRIGRAFLTAGPGYGGSCLPEQAIALSLTTAGRGIPTPLIAAVSHSNETHQKAIVSRLSALLGGDDGSLAGCRIALLGLAFKANTDDVRESPALSLARYLRAQRAIVVGTDPRALAKAGRADPELVTADTIEAAVDGADAVLVATEWQEYAQLDWADIARRMHGDLVYDTRGIVPRNAVTAAGLRYASLGRG